MEALGAIEEMSWAMVDESEVMMAQLLGACQDQDSIFGIESMFLPNQYDSSSLYWPNTTSGTSTFSFPSSEFESYELSDPNEIPVINISSESMDVCMLKEQVTTDYHFKFANDDELEIEDDETHLKRKYFEDGIGNKGDIHTESSKKKSKASLQVQKSIKSSRSKKGQKNVKASEEEESNNASYSSEDDSNTSEELNGGSGSSSSTKVKTRAGRGSATDPQSLYARKRRERINERLRILQTLVPNGTKVDISTMLEEAVQYVKFLQLQIKLLSSDDLWMYAPLAYNGMDLGLDLVIPLLKQ